MQQPLMVDGYQQQGGYPPQGGGYPPQGGGYPPQGGGYPPQGGFAPPGAGYPPQELGVMNGGGGSGAQAVGMAEKLAIKQKVSLLEVAGDTMSGMIPCSEMCCERPNEYEIFDARTGQKLLHAKEDSGFCCRCWCQPSHALQLHITDAMTGQQVMVIDRPFKCATTCPAWLPFCLQEATLYTGSDPENTSAAIGESKQPTCGGFFSPQVNVSGPGQDPFAVIKGPTCCFGGLTEMCCDQEFKVLRGEDNDAEVAQITKEKPENLSQAMTEIATDSDLFTLKFKDPSLQQNQKLTLLSSVLLLDYMFFEQNQPFECNPGGECSVTCCNMYLCGMLIPCKCSCGGGEDGGE
ncbi:Glycine-rich protein A3 [Diplonema papillatum]|nr:Glycine-rich protein A3 [Diplonema papillatum]